MALIFQVKGLNEVISLFSKLNPSIQKAIGVVAQKEIVMSAQRRIKYRYNVLGYGHGTLGTGFGNKSIMIEKTKVGYNLWGAGYIKLLDRAIRSHWVSMDTVEAHRANPGSTMFRRSPARYVFNKPPVFWRYKGPVVAPSIEELKKEIPQIIERQLNKAMQMAKS